jgi:hypothetical protein
MSFQLIPLTVSLEVEGQSDAPDVGRFSGTVIAVGMRDTDPISTPAEQENVGGDHTEGLSGFGSTYFLIGDADKPAPVWVSKAEVTSHRITESPSA